MKHVIIGTAGHIDHGKTLLIKALTGRDTDTLQEEKDRGISINLGFTFFDLPSGKRAGIIDVPGHEKFIKNMLAGVSGIDMVLLVIAADEGIMPQTREHFEILQLLNVKKGIVVLTKIDMVDKDWLKMIEEDITEELQDTFLQNAPIHEVSSKTGEGIKELVSEIDSMTDEIEVKDTEGHFRLPVDRVFSISGFGTVVTGTIISGHINVGDTAQIYPSKVITKIRGIQVHEETLTYAEAGQRCALNLSGVKSNDIKRGDVLSVENIMEPSFIVDVKLYYLKKSDKPLVNRQRVRLYHGTSEIICRVLLLDREELKGGEEAYAQLRLEKPLTSQRNDKFVIRSYSPMDTIGGGTIIEPSGKKTKLHDSKYIDVLRIKEEGSIEDIIENTIERLSSEYLSVFDILKSIGKNEENIQDKLDTLVNEGKIVKIDAYDKPVYLHYKFINYKEHEILEILEIFHKDNPLKVGISKEEIKNRVFGKNIKQKIYEEILNILENRKSIACNGSYISKFDFSIKYNKEQENIRLKIVSIYDAAKYMPPKFEDIILNEKNKKDFKMVYESLLESGVLTKVSEDCIILTRYYDDAIKTVKDYIEHNGGIAISEAKELLNTNRKYIVAILECFDNCKITKRMEDKRVLYK